MATPAPPLSRRAAGAREREELWKALTTKGFVLTYSHKGDFSRRQLSIKKGKLKNCKNISKKQNERFPE